MLSEFITEIQPEDVVLDVGANIGVYSCFAGKRASSVLAIEPYAPNVEAIKDNLRLNALENVSVRVCALGDDETTTALDIAGGGRATGKVSMTQNSDVHSENTAPVYRGDTVVSEVEIVPTIVKIDVEGAERLVISGLSETLSAPECRVVFCEVHSPERMRSAGAPVVSPDEIQSMLESHGFNSVELTKRNGEAHVIARKADSTAH
jgi:FkbM family methyltransferase